LIVEQGRKSRLCRIGADKRSVSAVSDVHRGARVIAQHSSKIEPDRALDRGIASIFEHRAVTDDISGDRAGAGIADGELALVEECAAAELALRQRRRTGQRHGTGGGERASCLLEAADGTPGTERERASSQSELIGHGEVAGNAERSARDREGTTAQSPARRANDPLHCGQ